MNTLPSRALRSAACFAIAVSAFAGVHARTPVKPTVVAVRHLKPVSTETLKPARAAATPLAARRATPTDSQPRPETIDSDGSRFRYDSCGCSSD